MSVKVQDPGPPRPKIHWIGPVREPEPRAWCGAIVGVALIVTGVALLVVAGAAATVAIFRAFEQ